MENFRDYIHSKLQKLHQDTEKMLDMLYQDPPVDPRCTEHFSLLDRKVEIISEVQAIQEKKIGLLNESLMNIQKQPATSEPSNAEFISNTKTELREMRSEIKYVESEQKLQDHELRLMRNDQDNDKKSIQALSVEVTELKSTQRDSENENESIQYQEFKIHKEEVLNDVKSIHGEIMEMKKKQNVSELFNEEVIKEFKAINREMKALGAKGYNEKKEKMVLIEEEIVGTWKPSSLHNYPHCAKPEDPIRKSQWLNGHLRYSLHGEYLTWKLFVLIDNTWDTVKETTILLGYETKYSDHTETWTFENNHLIIIFKNRTDHTIIKKFFQFTVDGKLHIVYHNLVDDVTCTRIYEKE
ncbi:MATH domain-containing protein [Caenorhabditis elegans]|uniref:MATH domain-containing protein n=1 Tax=Caenorhabditis elegans TaxID=6239 RepID=Q19069_CAEEL|nr:MATH domain-containing protein [Caenorhabditis elegans]CCD68744.1 MATH domain-containing protein [Caenorhabditis elegans]|eukprot:NP_495024.2 Uncharacterized protein CELE_EEED8.14 [Caenorhabditis elegans]